MKHIDQVFKDKLFNHASEVPEGMWEKIAPAIEKEPNRGLLWLAKGPLAEASTTKVQSLEHSADNTAPIETLAITMGENTKETTPAKKTPIKKQVSSKSTPSIEQVVASTTQVEVIQNEKEVRPIEPTSTSSIGSSVSHSDQLMKYGKPANLVITKSYLSSEGAIIEKSDLSKDNEISDPVYNVFINSEGLNAGAMMRIVEPLEKMPLPAFSTDLKKKVNL